MRPQLPPAGYALLAVAGLALVVGGGYGVAVGVESLETCGSTTMQAYETDDPPSAATSFQNLTASERSLVRRAIDGDDPDIAGAEWPWAEDALLVEYRGTVYEVVTVTTPCPFPPETILAVGALVSLAGVLALVPPARWVARVRRSE